MPLRYQFIGLPTLQRLLHKHLIVLHFPGNILVQEVVQLWPGFSSAGEKLIGRVSASGNQIGSFSGPWKRSLKKGCQGFRGLNLESMDLIRNDGGHSNMISVLFVRVKLNKIIKSNKTSLQISRHYFDISAQMSGNGEFPSLINLGENEGFWLSAKAAFLTPGTQVKGVP